MIIDEIIDDVRSANRVIEPALAVIAVVQKAVGIGGLAAERAIEIIRYALHSFNDVAAGRATQEQALEALERMRSDLAAKDAFADTALDARFRGGDQ